MYRPSCAAGAFGVYLIFNGLTSFPNHELMIRRDQGPRNKCLWSPIDGT